MKPGYIMLCQFLHTTCIPRPHLDGLWAYRSLRPNLLHQPELPQAFSREPYLKSYKGLHVGPRYICELRASATSGYSPYTRLCSHHVGPGRISPRKYPGDVACACGPCGGREATGAGSWASFTGALRGTHVKLRNLGEP